MTIGDQSRDSRPDIVLLHGWGSSPAVWHDVADRLAPEFRAHRPDFFAIDAQSIDGLSTLDAVTEALAKTSPRRAIVCGWSLGALIALNWALAYPDQVMRLVLIAATPRFVNNGRWQCGIDASVLDEFSAALAADCGGALRRFITLQAQGDAAANTVRLRLRECVDAHNSIGALLAGLQILKDTDLRERLPQVAQPVLLLHGTRDTVVPLAAAEFMARALPNATLKIFENAAHAPHVAGAPLVARYVTEFCRG
jgi:pimeloyl-[acyl-carrier protein] methyl ester esterase